MTIPPPDPATGLTSCLYRGQVMHARLFPKRHKFTYPVFLFGIDLDELDELARTIPGIARNRFSLYTFRDSDHLPKGHSSVRANLAAYLREQGVGEEPARVFLITNLRTLGYQFNPVSFYFLENAAGQSLGCVAEVSNTFREMKPYYLPARCLQEGRFRDRQVKHFYISPFGELDETLVFNLAAPEAAGIDLRVRCLRDDGKPVFLSALTARRQPLTKRNLAICTARFPLITFRVIALIHWEALRLFLRRMPFHGKGERPDLQRNLHAGPGHRGPHPSHSPSDSQ